MDKKGKNILLQNVFGNRIIQNYLKIDVNPWYHNDLFLILKWIKK